MPVERKDTYPSGAARSASQRDGRSWWIGVDQEFFRGTSMSAASASPPPKARRVHDWSLPSPPTGARATPPTMARPTATRDRSPGQVYVPVSRSPRNVRRKIGLRQTSASPSPSPPRQASLLKGATSVASTCVKRAARPESPPRRVSLLKGATPVASTCVKRAARPSTTASRSQQARRAFVTARRAFVTTRRARHAPSSRHVAPATTSRATPRWSHHAASLPARPSVVVQISSSEQTKKGNLLCVHSEGCARGLDVGTWDCCCVGERESSRA